MAYQRCCILYLVCQNIHETLATTPSAKTYMVLLFSARVSTGIESYTERLFGDICPSYYSVVGHFIGWGQICGSTAMFVATSLILMPKYH